MNSLQVKLQQPLVQHLRRLDMNTLFVAVGAIGLAFLIHRWRKSMKKTNAAFNVLLGKHTFIGLSEDRQKEVEARAQEILQDLMHGSFSGFNTETAMYGWYALAMNELGIRPAVSDYPLWNRVRNPFTAIYAGDPVLLHISDYIKRHFGVDVRVGTEHKLYDSFRKAA